MYFSINGYNDKISSSKRKRRKILSSPKGSDFYFGKTRRIEK